MSIKSLLTRTQKALVALRPECPGFGKANRLLARDDEDGYVPGVCPVCGGCHVLQIEEVIVLPDGRELSSAEFLAEKAAGELLDG